MHKSISATSWAIGDIMGDNPDELKPMAQSQEPNFIRRMAGPSAHKVGFGKDQAEINRLIIEASKGSAYYENEKRQDADWTVRIAKILERRDELLSGSNIGRVEAKVDRLFAEMEAKRDLSQTIVHVDMDAFFANVELQHDPELKDKPFAVVGLGIVTTASYDARKYGVRSAQPEFVAKRLCPELILVPVNYVRVGEVSVKVMEVCKRYDPNIYVAGCDEAYINITKYMQEHNLGAGECVEEIRTKIFEATNLTASAGIAPNMLLAKICSDRNKPNGQFQIPPTREAVMDFMRDLPVRKVPGIGRVGERVLQAIGVETCGDIEKARAFIWLMPKRFAVDFLFETHLGLSKTVVRPSQREERKSVGASRTFQAVDTKDAIFQKLEYIASLLERDLETEGWAGKIVILTYKLDNFRIHTRRATFGRWISKKEDLVNIGKDLIRPYLPLRIRLLGLRVTDLIDLRAPSDHGIKRYFGTDGNSPSKRRRLTPQPGRASESPCTPPKKRMGNRGESLSRPLTVEDEEGYEEELVGTAVEHEDELDDDEELGVCEPDQPQTPQSEAKCKVHEEKQIQIPFFGYRNVLSSGTGVIKVGNDKPKVTPKTKRPLSAIAQNRPMIALRPTTRSKSEQPFSMAMAGKSPSKSKLSPSSVIASPSLNIRAASVQPHHNTTASDSDAATAAVTAPVSKSKSQAGADIGGELETMVCPVCSRGLETDNSGLNAHIDFCLSRSAIREASAGSSMTTISYVKNQAQKHVGKGKGVDRSLGGLHG